MDFSKLDQHEKLALYGAVALVIGGLVSAFGGLLWLGVLAAIAAVIVILLPQFSPGTDLPGSKGTLLAVLGFVAAASVVIALLQVLPFLGALLNGAIFTTLLFLVAVAGGLLMAWAGWQALQAEGGKWRFGSATDGRSAAAPPPAAGTTTTATTGAAPPPATDADVASAPPPAARDPYDAPTDDRPRDV